MRDRAPFAVIGYGTIGRVLIAELTKGCGDLSIPLLVRPKYLAQAASEAPDILETPGEGRAAVAELAEGILGADADLVVASASALTDDEVYARIERAARLKGRQAIIASGALGSLDLLAAMAAAGLDWVAYRGVKPPAAWRGTPAEQACDLDSLTGSTHSGTHTVAGMPRRWATKATARP